MKIRWCAGSSSLAVALAAVAVAALFNPAPAVPQASLGASIDLAAPAHERPLVEEHSTRRPALRRTASVQAAANPLAPFARLIGGQWHLDGSYHEFEWGLAQQSVTTRSYFLIEGEPSLVSEGIWFWHPGEKVIKGAFTAIDMPVVFFDYTVRFEGDKMVSDLVAYDPAGNETTYVETWEFTDDTHYIWKLLSESPDGLQEVMGGTYARKK